MKIEAAEIMKIAAGYTKNKEVPTAYARSERCGYKIIDL